VIITITSNPALDQTMWFRKLEAGEVNRAHETQLDPAGKGINVSRVAHRLSAPTMALGFLGGETGDLVEHALTAERVPHHFVRVNGRTRINITINDEATGVATNCWAPGPTITATEAAELRSLIEVWLDAGRMLVLAGSLAAGLPSDSYADWTRLAHSKGVRVIVDASGDALNQALAAKPDLIKPNVSEAETLLGRRLPSFDAVVGAARELEATGIGTVVISMGGEGLVCASGGGVWRVRPPAVQRRSTVGSGDSLVAGIAITLARGGTIQEGLRLGTAAGAATAMSAGTSLAAAADVTALLGRVVVEPVPVTKA
jgi:1-phosphofructokinase family hexose kinase